MYSWHEGKTGFERGSGTLILVIIPSTKVSAIKRVKEKGKEGKERLRPSSENPLLGKFEGDRVINYQKEGARE